MLDGLRKGDRVTVLDVSPQFQNTIDEIDRTVGEDSIILFDHHQSTYDKIGRRAWAVVDTARCGASVYWNWLMEHADEPVRRRIEGLRDIVEVANDRDLWINLNPDGRLWQSMVTMCGEYGVLARLISNPSAELTGPERELALRFTAAQEERFKRAREAMTLSRIGGGKNEMAYLGDGYLEFGDTSDFCGSILDKPDECSGAPALVALAFKRPSGTWAVSLRSREGLAGRVTSLLKDGRSIRGGGHDDAAALYFPASYNEKSIRESILAALAAKAESSSGMGVTLGDLLKGAMQ
ncbi:MAG: phosphohydrolase [Synergistaceae bacterium]|jgi:nanoRNase/pAp phosphatase (c-di-AMP/oligoRNAs hydrolase)|nr:phosphohydrolase [Synergistaceae bacterium]